MSRTRLLLRSFAGGEVSPLLHGRVDLQPYQTGLALCRNFVTLPQGPAKFRPGTRFLQYAADAEARLVPFVYSDDQAYIVEFAGNGKLRLHTVEGTLLDDDADEPIVSISNANPAVIALAEGARADGDDVYLDVEGMPEVSGRWYRLAYVSTSDGNDHFHLTTPTNPAGIDATGYGAFVSGTASSPILLDHPYSDETLRTLRYAQSADVLTVVSREHPVYALRRTGPNEWAFEEETFGPIVEAPTTKLTATKEGSGGNERDEVYTYTKVAIMEGDAESFAAPESDAVKIDLTVAGNYVKLTPSEGEAPEGYRWNFYKKLNGLWGYIGQSPHTFEDRNIVPDLSIAPPEYGDDEFGEEGDRPGTVSYHQQRKVFAGTINRPQTIWMTRNGTERDMTFTVPARDDNALAFGIASRELQTIEHVVPLRQLLVLTASGVWKIVPQNNDVLTPSSISADLVAYEGASPVQPITVGASVLYGFARGGRIGEVKYADSANDFTVSDVCLLAPHLFDGYAITDMAMMETPARLLWALRSDGRLLSMTYQPEQQVLAWHQHDLGGEVRSICVVPNVSNAALSEDVLVAFVRRKNGDMTYHTLELLHGFGDYPAVHQRTYWDDETNLAEALAVHVDSALVYDGEPVDRLIGLHHLEGRTVSIVADGAVHPPLVVQNGEVTLEAEASRIVIGLPYTGRLQTLPLSIEGADAEGQGTLRSVSRVHMRVLQSSGIYVGPDFANMSEVKARTDEPYGVAPRWKTGQIEQVIDPVWSHEGAVCIEQRDPMPLALLSMTLEVELGG